MKIAINWYASTGSFHRNGRSFIRSRKVPSQSDAKCHAIAKDAAEKWAATVGKPIKEFSIRLIGT